MTTANDHAPLTGDYVLDPTHTRIGFVARHAMVTKVRGAFNEFDRHRPLDAETRASRPCELTIKAASIDTRNADRDAHLRSNDFFDMDDTPRSPSLHRVARPARTTVRGHRRPHHQGRHPAGHRPLHLRGPGHRPVRQPPARLRGQHDDQPQGLGRDWNAALETGGVLVSDKVTLEFEVSAVKQS